MSANWIDFRCDLVICIETTNNVRPFADQLRSLAKDFLRNYSLAMCDSYGLDSIEKYRVKFILFKDYACCQDAMLETEFFNIDSIL